MAEAEPSLISTTVILYSQRAAWFRLRSSGFLTILHDFYAVLFADPAPVDAMWYNRKEGTGQAAQWITVRGSSKQEGYHAKLHAVLVGSNYSPALAHVLCMWFNYRWNIDRGIQNRGDPDYKTYRLWDLQTTQARPAQSSAILVAVNLLQLAPCAATVCKYIFAIQSSATTFFLSCVTTVCAVTGKVLGSGLAGVQSSPRTAKCAHQYCGEIWHQVHGGRKLPESRSGGGLRG